MIYLKNGHTTNKKWVSYDGSKWDKNPFVSTFSYELSNKNSCSITNIPKQIDKTRNEYNIVCSQETMQVLAQRQMYPQTNKP